MHFVLKTAVQLILLFGLLQAIPVRANSCSTIIMVSNNSHFAMVHRIESALFTQLNSQKKLVNVNAEMIKRPDFFDQYNEPCLIVTLGSQALANALTTQTRIPILSTLTRKNTFHQLLKEHNRKLDDSNLPITALYIDQPLDRQLYLIKCLFPNTADREPIGVLLGQQSATEQHELKHLANVHHLKINTVIVNKNENPIAVLDNLLDEVKILLAVPDNTIYNTQTAHGIFLTTFHKHTPLIGYSRTYVNNGALAAIYANTKQLAEHTAQIIKTIVEKDKIPLPQYPRAFVISVNQQVIRSMGIVIETETTLNSMMEIFVENQTHGSESGI